MTLGEVAQELAKRLECKVLQSDDPSQVTVEGKGYQFAVAPFFGGWQATLLIPNQAPTTFYGEAVEMLESRLRGKLIGRPVD